MERIDTSRIADQKTSQQKNNLQEPDTKTPKKAQGYGSQTEVPCCCPGCFSFDF